MDQAGSSRNRSPGACGLVLQQAIRDGGRHLVALAEVHRLVPAIFMYGRNSEVGKGVFTETPLPIKTSP
eukprot:361774-Chlamydomonas_euryale.AAC.2